MSGSGVNRTLVPRRLATRPTVSSAPSGKPRAKLCRYRVWPGATSTSSRSAKALTTEMPTPCSPPEVW